MDLTMELIFKPNRVTGGYCPAEHPFLGHTAERDMNLPLLEVPALKKTFNKCRQSASQTCTVQVPHDSIFPCWVVSFFDVKEDGNSVLPLDKRLDEKMISSAAIFLRNPHWTGVRSLCFSKYQTRRSLIIRSMILHMPVSYTHLTLPTIYSV